jgi:aryl-alcohol dehydrogenase-like predicted oxidoreductase
MYNPDKPLEGYRMSDFLDKRELGQTKLLSSRLGIGSSFGAPARVIEEAFHRGINYLYWGSIRRPEFGRAMRNLAKQHRDELILTVQSYSRVPHLIVPSVEIALRRAGLEYFDFLLLGARNDVPADAYTEVFERLRERGKVRFLSLSTHNRPLLAQLLDAYRQGQTPYELFMLRYNAVHRGAENDVFPFVPEQRRPGIVAYTATRWGHLLDPSKMPPGEAPLAARDCYRFALSHPTVDLVLCGPANAEQMKEAISALEGGPLEPEERVRIERIGDYVYGKHRPQFPDAGDAKDVSSGRTAN